ncbi:MAG TPA: S53 family peptidase [Nocardioides sp.]|nr:S53 family peptidase [Nocardioides sp.]
MGVLSVTTATALAAALAAIPAGSADGSTAVASASSHHTGFRSTPVADQGPKVVTLLTGDQVVVRHDASGKVITTLTPRSPDYGRPVEFLNTGTHTWVVPKLAPSVRARFDTSVFDVAALARAGRSVPLSVTFAKGVSPRSLPGVQVRTSSARGVAGGRTTVAASYDARRPLPTSLAYLRGVSHVALAGATPQVDPAYELHTLTINGTTAKGKPIPGADVFVFNADDARLFTAFGGVIDGQWKVSVPTGNYDILVSDFTRVVVRQVHVDDDTATDVDMGSATVKPQMTAFSGLSTLSPSLDILGSDTANRGGFDFGWSGIFPKVNAQPTVAAGRLHTEVANLWSAKGYQPFTFHGNQVKVNPIKKIVGAKEVVKGIPHDLTFHYHKKDFAQVAIKHYATGPKQSTFDLFFAIAPVDQGYFVEGIPSVRPSLVQGMFLARKNLTWDSSTMVSDDFRSFTELDATATYHHGQHAQVPFFRGPVTPVADRGGESKRVNYSCQLCVIKGQLGGFLSMFTSAGTDQFGVTTSGSWEVLRGHRRVSRGRAFLAPYVPKVKPGQHLKLVATTGPANKKYVLSRNVTDTWAFTVPNRKRAIVPILRAAYVPPTDLHSVGRPGHVSFPITFDNLGPVDAKVRKAAVKWSVDGRHWHAARLARQDKNTFRVSYRNPAATKAHPYLSLKVTAHDTGGRSITETVQNAYELPNIAAHRSVDTVPQHRATFRPGKLCRTSGEHSYSCFVKLGGATRTAGRAAPDPAGWGAPALRQAYGLGDDPNPGTVAVIVAYDYPHAQADMNHYRAQYGLPACTGAGGCFTKINQKGQTGNYPEQDFGWGVEASLDLQMISAACPTCHVVLVEANNPTDGAFFHAETAAVNAGATVTNHSFGRIELTGADKDALHFEHPGVSAVASTGDFGYGPASFPASSPNVVAVGGTTLARSSTDERGWTEKAWAYAGSGCSAYFEKPVGQDDTACHGRTIADVSAVARGLAIYNTSLPRRYRGWLTVDGTSASSPLIAGMIGSAGTPGVTPQLLYAHAGDFNDVVGGHNGFCQGSYICTGVEGYDGPTGLGTPQGVSAFGVP